MIINLLLLCLHFLILGYVIYKLFPEIMWLLRCNYLFIGLVIFSMLFYIYGITVMLYSYEVIVYKITLLTGLSNIFIILELAHIKYVCENVVRQTIKILSFRVMSYITMFVFLYINS